MQHMVLDSLLLIPPKVLISFLNLVAGYDSFECKKGLPYKLSATYVVLISEIACLDGITVKFCVLPNVKTVPGY